MIGKDILRFHSIYWPIILMALDLPLPTRLVAHGWFVMKDGKMSKSKGNVIYPEMLVERFGLDPLRYYLMRSLPVGSDGTFTPEDYLARINYELANDLGNLLNRTVAMINKYFDGQVPAYIENVTDYDADLAKVVAENIEEFHKQMNAVDFPRALDAVWNIISRTNKYIDETAPWVLAKEDGDEEQLRAVMAHLAASLRVVAHLIPTVHDEHFKCHHGTASDCQWYLTLKILNFQVSQKMLQLFQKELQSFHVLTWTKKLPTSNLK